MLVRRPNRRWKDMARDGTYQAANFRQTHSDVEEDYVSKIPVPYRSGYLGTLY